MYVSLQTLDRAVRMVHGLADLRDPDDLAPTVLPALTNLVGCDVITYNTIGPTPADVYYQDWPPRGLEPSTQDRFRRFAHEHPSITHYRRTLDTRPVMISDFLTVRQFHNLGLYAEFFRPIPVEYQLSFSLETSYRSVVGIALNRGRGPFEEADREILNILRAPLTGALARVRLRQHADARRRTQAPDVEPTALTRRETALLDLVALGRTNHAIARAMNISPRTVAKHLEHIYRKLDVTNRAAAVATGRSNRRSPP